MMWQRLCVCTAWQFCRVASARVCIAQSARSHRWTHARRCLIASIMEEVNRGAWEEIIGRCEEVGVDAFEINFSCPHGMPERKMGMAMGQNPDLLGEARCCLLCSCRCRGEGLLPCSTERSCT
jgi:hypothetical protein